MDGGDYLPVLDIVSLFGGENKQFSFARGQLHLILGAVVPCQVEEVLQLVDVVGADSRVICLANSSNMEVTQTASKTRILSLPQLLVVVELVVVGGVGTALLNATLVVDRTHEVAVPSTVSLAASKSQVPVQNSLVFGCIQVQPSYKDLAEDTVKGGPSIKEEDKEGSPRLNGVVDGGG